MEKCIIIQIISFCLCESERGNFSSLSFSPRYNKTETNCYTHTNAREEISPRSSLETYELYTYRTPIVRFLKTLKLCKTLAITEQIDSLNVLKVVQTTPPTPLPLPTHITLSFYNMINLHECCISMKICNTSSCILLVYCFIYWYIVGTSSIPLRCGTTGPHKKSRYQ